MDIVCSWTAKHYSRRTNIDNAVIAFIYSGIIICLEVLLLYYIFIRMSNVISSSFLRSWTINIVWVWTMGDNPEYQDFLNFLNLIYSMKGGLRVAHSTVLALFFRIGYTMNNFLYTLHGFVIDEISFYKNLVEIIPGLFLDENVRTRLSVSAFLRHATRLFSPILSCICTYVSDTSIHIVS